MEQLIISDQTSNFDRDTRKFKNAVDSCVPSEAVAHPLKSYESIDLNFLHLVSLVRTNELVQEIKRTGSIQMQLFKADPNAPESEFEWDIYADTDKSLKLSVNFTDPKSISASTLGDDRLRVLFKDASKFISCPILGQE